jgi:tRNA dimethylallyltransferase
MSAGANDAAAVLLMGPTCSGKSALALDLARRWPIEIVSVDSANVYRGLDIGTSKPTPADRAAVPHHLIDICDPKDAYSAGRFRLDALALIDAIRARGRVPLLVGGTMLYFRALRHGMAPLPEASADVRARLDRRAREHGWQALHAELACLDPPAAARIHATDSQRIQRALEVIELTGRRLSELHAETDAGERRYAAFALVPFDRDALYQRIDARFEAMIAAGLVDEVRALRARGDLSPDLPSMRSVGYRQVWNHLAGEFGLERAIEAGQRATRNLAKRQLTWLKGECDLVWIRSLAYQELVGISGVIEHMLSCG